jgi:hypothetical protein
MAGRSLCFSVGRRGGTEPARGSVPSVARNLHIELRSDCTSRWGRGERNAGGLEAHLWWRRPHPVSHRWVRTRSAAIDQEISWGDEIFPVNAEVQSKFDFDVYQLGYEYALRRRESHELAASIGLHVTDLSASLSARGSVGDGGPGRAGAETGSATAPLPVIGLNGLWALPNDLWLNATAQYFYLKTGDYKGRIQDYRVALTWQPQKWLGVGIGYDYFLLDVDVDRPRFTGTLDWTYRGPMLFYSASF